MQLSFENQKCANELFPGIPHQPSFALPTEKESAIKRVHVKQKKFEFYLLTNKNLITIAVDKT